MRLAEMVEVSARILSAYENGASIPSPGTLQRLAERLEFPGTFFTAGEIDDLPVDAVSFRSVSKLPASKRDMALSTGRLAIDLHTWIAARFRLPLPDVPSLTRFSAHPARESEHEGPELAAEVVRARWGLGNAQVPNMVHLVEAHGIKVSSLAQRCVDVDAFSLWWRDTPYIFLNTRKSAERGRFDAAHELGHLILHGEGQTLHGPEIEREADRFAAAFLMPRDSVLARMPRNPSLPQILAGSRKIWKVAAMALAHRLHEVGLSTDWHYRTTCRELGKRGYRRAEPSGIPRESSQVFDKVFRALRDEGTGPSNIAQELHLDQRDLADLVFGLTMTVVDGNGTGGPSQRPRLHAVGERSTR